MKYTIEQINEAWIKFNKPMYLVDKKKISEEELEKGFIEYEGRGNLRIIPKTDFISYLISYFSKGFEENK